MDFRVNYRAAALDFLTNISLDGYNNDKIEQKIDSFKNKDNKVSKTSDSLSQEVSQRKPIEIGGSLKLNPKKMLESLNYRRKHYTSHSSISTIDDIEKFSNSRQITTKKRMVILSPTNQSTFSVYSILAFSKRLKFVKHDGTLGEKPEMPRSRLISGNSNSTIEGILAFGLIQIPNEEDVSYQHFLRPIIYQDSKSNLLTLPLKTQPNISPVKGSKNADWKYDPNLLDDPEIITSRNKVVMQLPGYLTTIVNYVKPIDIKNDINEQFRQKFPDINLSLTKLRSLKSNILTIANKVGIDLWTVATAFAYFEILVLKNLISKQNRKLCCAASLILSAKINDVKRSELAAILQELEAFFKLHKKELLQYELYVFVALEFGLLLDDQAVHVHYRRLLTTI